MIMIKLNYDKNKIKQIKRSLVLITKMESKDELKEIAIKKLRWLRIEKLKSVLVIFYWTKNSIKELRKYFNLYF